MIPALREQSLLMVVELFAGVAQPGHTNFGFCPEPEDRVGRRRLEVKAAGKDILTQSSRASVKALRLELVEQFPMDEMDLPEVGLGRIGTNPRTMLYGLAHMSIALNPESFQDPDLRLTFLAESVRGSRVDRDHPAIEMEIHQSSSTAC
jgi:hypothetical protein